MLFRSYLIKTVVGPDDYASMQEVVRRRYSRILEEQGELPDLKKMPVYWTKIYLAEAAVMIIGVTAFIMIIVRIAAWRSFKRSERRNKDE